MSLESDRVERELRKMIITLELAPGEHVTQAYLTERLKCGRMPLREAIQRLISTGWVVHTPNRGISIAPLDILQFGAVLEAFECIHNFSARLAAQRISEEQLSELEVLVAKAEELDGKSDYSVMGLLDFEFHRLIGRATGNEYLADTIVRLHPILMRFASICYSRQGTVKPFWEEHRKILMALRDRDPEEAERQSHNHLQKSGKERVLAALGMLP